MALMLDKEKSFNKAVELAKSNLESSNEWVKPEDVNQFIEEVYTFLSSKEF